MRSRAHGWSGHARWSAYDAPVSDRPAFDPQVRAAGLAAGTVAGLALLGLAVSTHGAHPGWAWLLAALGLLLTVWSLTTVLRLRSRTGRLRVRSRDGGLEVVGSAVPRVLDVVAAAVLLLALVGAVIAQAAGASTGTLEALPVVVLAVLALVAFWRVVAVVAGRRRTASVWLYVDGVVVSGPGGRERFVWSDLTAVSTSPLALLGHGGSSVPLPERELRSEPGRVAGLVGHYLARSGDRRELADERAVRRVHDDAFHVAG